MSSSVSANPASENPDVVLIGAGIMSATLGTVLKELEPTLDVVMFETLNDCAQESSEAWNNAGRGHAMATGTTIPGLKRLRDAIDANSKKWAGVVKIGRTHLEDATPLTVARSGPATPAPWMTRSRRSSTPPPGC
jgi:L-2-hydroxyglutarate oxidase LhgO